MFSEVASMNYPYLFKKNGIRKKCIDTVTDISTSFENII